MRLRSLTAILLLFFLFTSCRKEIYSKEFTFDFNESKHGWEVLFSDYPVGQEDFYELSFEHTGLPVPLDNAVKSLKVSGNNHSDDLLSVIYKKVNGLKPNTKYLVSFNVEFASNACISCAGAGGSPNLALGGGGIPFAPANTVNDGYYRKNFDIEIQGYRSNNTIKMLGRIGTGETPLNSPYKLISLNNSSEPIQLTTDANGELWLVIGTDSGFEATTTLYYKKIAVTFKK